MTRNNLYMDIRPRMVSVYELLAKLLPLMDGIPWAEDALMDLWQMGAPDPSPKSQPCNPGTCQLKAAGRHECTPKWGCAMVKRVLLPAQFGAWWHEVSQRQGLDLTAEQALAGNRLAKKFGGGGRMEVVETGQNGRTR